MGSALTGSSPRFPSQNCKLNLTGHADCRTPFYCRVDDNCSMTLPGKYARQDD